MSHDASSYMFEPPNGRNGTPTQFSLHIGHSMMPSTAPSSTGKPKLRHDVKLRLANKHSARRSNHTVSSSCDSTAYFNVVPSTTSPPPHRRTSSHGTANSTNSLSIHSPFTSPQTMLGNTSSGRLVLKDHGSNHSNSSTSSTLQHPAGGHASSALGAVHSPSARFLFQPPTPMNNTPSVRYLLRKSEAAPRTIVFGQQINALLQVEESLDEHDDDDDHDHEIDDDLKSSYDVSRPLAGSQSRSGMRSPNHSMASNSIRSANHSVASISAHSPSRSPNQSVASHSGRSRGSQSRSSKSDQDWMDERSRTLNDIHSLPLDRTLIFEPLVPMTRSRTMNALPLPPDPAMAFHAESKMSSKSVPATLSQPPPPAPPAPPPPDSAPPPPPNVAESNAPSTASMPSASRLRHEVSEDVGPKYKEPTLAANHRRIVYSPPLFRLNPLFTDYEELKKAPSSMIELVGIEFVDDAVSGQQRSDKSERTTQRLPRLEESRSAVDGRSSGATEPDERERKHAAKRKENEDWQIMGDLLFSIRHSLISRKRAAAEEAVLDGGGGIGSRGRRGKVKGPRHLEVSRNEWSTFVFEEYAASLFAELRSRWLSAEPLSDFYVKRLFGVHSETVPLEKLDINRSCKFYWRRLNTNSKSGQIFFQSVNGEYIMKSMPKSEVDFFRKSFVEHYHEHMLSQPDSLLMRIMGCYQIQYKSGAMAMSLASNNEYNSRRRQDVEKGVFVMVMKSILFCEMTPTVKMHQIYDLKGSTHNRSASRYRLELDAATLAALKEIDTHSFEQEIDGVDNVDATVKRINYSYSAGFYTPRQWEMGDKFKNDETAQRCISVHYRGPHRETVYKRSRVLKDLDFLQDGERIIVGDKIKRKYCNQLRTDLDFLIAMNVMDYSLLLGIHRLDMKRRHGGKQSASKPKRMKAGNLFTFEFGGMCAERIMMETGHHDSDSPKSSSRRKNIYFSGIIDFLQKYNTKKMAESYYKRLKVTEGKNAISAVDSETYANRLYEFIAKRID